MKQLNTIFFIILSGVAFGNANFTSDKTKGCPPLVVNFADSSSTNTVDWLWDFGNGNTSTLQNPSATFLEPGLYPVKLVTFNHLGESDSLTKTVQVFKLPKVDFYVDKPVACTYDIVHFFHDVTLGDAPITKYGWGYGNGLATNVPLPSLKYPIGSYSITLVVEDSNGCSASLIKPAYVNVFAPPVAAFTAAPTKTCNPSLTVNFNNSSTGAGITYLWDFDGTNKSTAKDPPPFTYHQQKYNANLTVTDSNGCVGKKSVTVQATAMSADLKPSKYIVCTGETVNFTNTSNFPGTQWSWTFGDSTGSNLKNPGHAYMYPGIYDVSLSIKDGECEDSVMYLALLTVTPGAKIENIGISADVKESCTPPLTVNFTNTTPDMSNVIGMSWDFGDGSSSTEFNPTHTYTKSGSFTITIQMMDSGGCITTATFPAFINTSGPPVNFATPAGCFGSTYKFKATGASTFLWTFHDGTTSTSATPSKIYSDPGKYTVTLWGKSALGCEKTITKTISIDTVDVDFDVNSTFSPCPPFVAVFNNNSKTSGLKYSWDFGDGVKDSKSDPIHIYYYPGKYTVKLTGTNKNGCSKTVVYKDLIEVQGPTGKFDVTPKKGCLPLEVSLKAEPSSNTMKFWCDMGDGNVVEDSASFKHTYTEERVYHPKFVLIDHIGCAVSYPLDSIITYAVPTLTAKDTSICQGSVASINVTSTGSKIQWTPSLYLDCDTCKSVNVSSPDTITYEIIASNKLGCESHATVVVNVDPLPKFVDTLAVNLCRTDQHYLNVGTAQRIEWTPSKFLNDTTSFNPICMPTHSIDYVVTGYNKLGCTATAFVPVTVKDKVDVSLPTDLGVCPFDTVQIHSILNFGSVLGVQYQWSPPYYLSNSRVESPYAYMKNRQLTFQLIASSGQCAPDTENVTVKIFSIPNLEVSGDVTTTANAEVELMATSGQKVSYSWTAEEPLSCVDCRRPVIYPTHEQTVHVVVTNEFGCEANDSIHIEIKGCDENTVYIPNTFTPNGDGHNDKFLVRSPAITSLDYFRVFDKWGHLVFETNELDKGWDGNSVYEKAESQGVYVYVMQGKCDNGNTVLKSGNVTALR